MDSLTQFALGAAVGEAVAGHRLGRRALLWGGLMGTLPDLDVLLAPVQTAAEALHFHRGPTHSLFFAFVAAPLLGWALARMHRARGPDLGDARTWIVLVFWALWTHPMLDYFTIYGTQLLWPLTDHPFALGSIFIIDLLYSGPLFVAVLAAAVSHDPLKRLRRVRWGLGLATAYLALSVALHARAAHVLADEWARRGITADRMLVGASPFNTILWFGLADVDSGFVASTYSLLDPSPQTITQTFVPQRADELDGLRRDATVETLLWFSQGWHSLDRRADGLHLRDLRFGRTDAWLSDRDAGYIFDFRLLPLVDGTWTFEQERPRLDPGAALRVLAERLRGRVPTPPPSEP